MGTEQRIELEYDKKTKDWKEKKLTAKDKLKKMESAYIEMHAKNEGLEMRLASLDAKINGNAKRIETLTVELKSALVKAQAYKEMLFDFLENKYELPKV